MAIPTMTKEEIWSIKDLVNIENERSLTDSELDDLVGLWTTEAQGYVKLKIMESYHEYISEDSWRVCIKYYCKWQAHDQDYSVNQQELSNNNYIKLEETLRSLKENVMEQAKLNVVPNKRTNFSVYNDS